MTPTPDSEQASQPPDQAAAPGTPGNRIIALCAAVVRHFCGEPGDEADAWRQAACAARDEYDGLRDAVQNLGLAEVAARGMAAELTQYLARAQATAAENAACLESQRAILDAERKKWLEAEARADRLDEARVEQVYRAEKAERLRDEDRAWSEREVRLRDLAEADCRRLSCEVEELGEAKARVIALETEVARLRRELHNVAVTWYCPSCGDTRPMRRPPADGTSGERVDSRRAAEIVDTPHLVRDAQGVRDLAGDLLDARRERDEEQKQARLAHIDAVNELRHATEAEAARERATARAEKAEAEIARLRANEPADVLCGRLGHDWLKVGTLVDYHSMIGGPVTRAGMVVRWPPEKLASGDWVVWLQGKAGCVACETLTPHRDLQRGHEGGGGSGGRRTGGHEAGGRAGGAPHRGEEAMKRDVEGRLRMTAQEVTSLWRPLVHAARFWLLFHFSGLFMLVTGCWDHDHLAGRLAAVAGAIVATFCLLMLAFAGAVVAVEEMRSRGAAETSGNATSAGSVIADAGGKN